MGGKLRKYLEPVPVPGKRDCHGHPEWVEPILVHAD